METPSEKHTIINTEKQENISLQTLQPHKDQSNFQEKTVDTTQAEKRFVGIITRATWFAFGKALGGTAICLTFFFVIAITQGCLLFTIVQLGFWAEDETAKQHSPKWFILILSLTLSVVFLSIVRAIFSFFIFIKASQRLHDKMLESVIDTKIQFFDTNPLGRILNRFSADSKCTMIVT